MANVFATQAIWVEIALPNAQRQHVPETLSVLDMGPVRMVLVHAVLATRVRIALPVVVLEPLSVVEMGRVEPLAVYVKPDLPEKTAL